MDGNQKIEAWEVRGARRREIFSTGSTKRHILHHEQKLTIHGGGGYSSYVEVRFEGSAGGVAVVAGFGLVCLMMLLRMRMRMRTLVLVFRCSGHVAPAPRTLLYYATSQLDDKSVTYFVSQRRRKMTLPFCPSVAARASSLRSLPQVQTMSLRQRGEYRDPHRRRG